MSHDVVSLYWDRAAVNDIRAHTKGRKLCSSPPNRRTPYSSPHFLPRQEFLHIIKLVLPISQLAARGCDDDRHPNHPFTLRLPRKRPAAPGSP